MREGEKRGMGREKVRRVMGRKSTGRRARTSRVQVLEDLVVSQHLVEEGVQGVLVGEEGVSVQQGNVEDVDNLKKRMKKRKKE